MQKLCKNAAAFFINTFSVALAVSFTSLLTLTAVCWIASIDLATAIYLILK
jgi:hypothetical protein